MENSVFQRLSLLKERQKKYSLEYDTSKVIDLMEVLSKSEGKIKEKYIFLKVMAS